MFTPKSGFGKIILMTFLCVIGFVTLQSQDNALSTDRPDQTEASSVVGKGVLQIETGAVFSKKMVILGHSDRDILRTRDYATTLMRYGIDDRVELRLATSYTELDFVSNQDFSGFQPLTLGAKVALAKESGIWPEIALIGHLTFPWIGDEIFVPDKITPDFRFSLSHTLSQRFSLGYNLGMEWEEGVCCASIIYTIALGASLFGPVSGFVESYGDIGDFLNLVDYGFTVLITPDLQLDFSHGFCLWCYDNDHFLNAGISARFGE